MRCAGRRGRRPLRKRILWCVGEGLCPSRGRPQGSPLRKRYKGCGTKSAGGQRRPPLRRGQGVQWAGDRKGRPYERVARGAVCGTMWASSPTGGTGGTMGGRPQGSPLRKRYMGCGKRADVGIGPYGYIIVSAVVGGRGRTPPLRGVTRSACVRRRAAALHQGSFLQRSSVLWTTWATLWPRPG